MILEIIAISLFLAGALVLYVDYVTERSLREKLSTELPETIYADVENITHKYDAEYGTVYHLKARKRDGSIDDVEIKCKSGNVNKYARIRI